MDAMTVANHAFCGLILIWAAWTIFSDYADDGIIGKCLLTIVAIACLANFIMNHRITEKPDGAELFMNGALAAYLTYEVVATYIRAHGRKKNPDMNTRKTCLCCQVELHKHEGHSHDEKTHPAFHA